MAHRCSPLQHNRRPVHDDEELLALVASGNQDMLASLVDRHGRGLRIFATRYLGNTGDAEEVVQDVFLTVWKQAHRFDPRKARASTWLYKITANRCIDYRRRRALRAFIGLDDVQDSLASAEPDAEARTSARQELSLIRTGMSHLPERQRMALLLKVVADLDIPAIAEVMGRSPGSVEQLLVRARRALRNRMAVAERGAERETP